MSASGTDDTPANPDFADNGSDFFASFDTFVRRVHEGMLNAVIEGECAVAGIEVTESETVRFDTSLCELQLNVPTCSGNKAFTPYLIDLMNESTKPALDLAQALYRCDTESEAAAALKPLLGSRYADKDLALIAQCVMKSVLEIRAQEAGNA